MRGGIAGVSAYRHFQRQPGIVILPLTGIQHGEVVVGFGQLRIISRQVREYVDGIGHLTLLGEDQPFQEARLCVFWLAGEIAIYLAQSLAVLPLFEQLVRILNIVGVCSHAGA